ncbi:hypothetical protein D9M71_802360 [compost metagenome]
MLELHRRQHVPAASFLNFDVGRWSPIEKPGRAQATLDRVRNGRERFGDRFIMPYYGKGSGTTGRDINLAPTKALTSTHSSFLTTQRYTHAHRKPIQQHRSRF